MKHMKPMEIMDQIASMFPDAKCELNHANVYEMAIAVILSAQSHRLAYTATRHAPSAISQRRLLRIITERFRSPWRI